jgi:spermidine synthase
MSPLNDEEWLSEQLHPYYRKSLRIKNKLVEERTPYQFLQVFETEFFGKALVLDGIIQLTERDNMGYHEMIVHVPALAVADPKRILIVGGGDGGSLQQALKHPGVKEVVVCELDQRVVDVCREHFTAFGDPYKNPRATLVVQDAFAYLAGGREKFDVIVSDTTDPIGMAERLFSEEFYHLMKGALNPGGAMATQCEQMFFDIALIKEIMGFTKTLAKHPAYYHAMIPTYPGGGIGFMYVSDVPWTDGLNKPYPAGLNYLNAEVHRAAFALPEFFRREVAGG